MLSKGGNNYANYKYKERQCVLVTQGVIISIILESGVCHARRDRGVSPLKRVNEVQTDVTSIGSPADD